MTTEELDKRLITLVAMVVLSVVCLLHYFSRNSGLLLNLLFAGYKIILIVVFIIGGCVASRQEDNGKHDWGDQPIPVKDSIAAMIYIIYSYQGWENANYVSSTLQSALMSNN
jgi:amino acid transporter